MVPSSLTGDHTDLLRAFSLPFMIAWTHTMFSSTRFWMDSFPVHSAIPWPGAFPYFGSAPWPFLHFSSTATCTQTLEKPCRWERNLAVGNLSTPASRRQHLEPEEQTDPPHSWLRATTQLAPAPLLTQAHILLFQRAVPWPPLLCVLTC